MVAPSGNLYINGAGSIMEMATIGALPGAAGWR